MNAKWLGKLRKLNPSVSKAKGTGNARFAPHKPLLLLCLIDLAEQGELRELVVGKTPELRLRFDSYWGIVQGRWGGRPGLDLPFHYLSNQGFWIPLRGLGVSVHFHSELALRLSLPVISTIEERIGCELQRVDMSRTYKTVL